VVNLIGLGLGWLLLININIYIMSSIAAISNNTVKYASLSNYGIVSSISDGI
jgi:hypothetical protein